MILSIVILNYKSEGLTRYCLKNIIKSEPALDYEIIVVDNASPDGGIKRLIKEFKQLRFIQLDENKGFSAGNNEGIKKAGGKFILLLNPDVVMVKSTLEKLVSYMEKHREVGMAAPKLLNPNGSIQYSCLRFPTWSMPLFRRTPLGKLKKGKKYLKRYLMQDFNHQSNKPVEWLFGACLIIRKEVIEKVGLLDENYFLYIQDTDWCRRFWEKGFPVHYIADVALIHYHHRESALNPGISGILNYVSRVHFKDFWYYLKKYRGKPNPGPEKFIH